MQDLFDGHYAAMKGLAFVLLGDGYLAEEVAMEAFTKVLSGWRRFRAVEWQTAYLRRAVINLCNSRHRRRHVEQRVNAMAHSHEERTPRAIVGGEHLRLGPPGPDRAGDARGDRGVRPRCCLDRAPTRGP